MSFGIILLFLLSAVAPMVFGVNIKTSNKEDIDLPEQINGTIDAQWPMYKNNPRNTGRCEYNTSNNPGGELWKYSYDGWSEHSTVIDKDGILYVPTWFALHSVYPDGTKRWVIEHGDLFTYTPALGEDGTIYFGTTKRFFAYYPNGTMKWTLDNGKKFSGYPTIGNDGTIYVGTDDGYLYAIYPNGTIYWEYYVGEHDWIYSPAVDNQGNIYFTTAYKKSLYCLNPDGTLKWKYKTIQQLSYGPVIGDDGTIYVVPIYNLVAVNPDGTKKWEVDMYDWAGNPTLAHDGTIIIVGTGDDYVTAVDPLDGSIIWQYQVSNSVNYVSKSEVAIGGDGTMYFAYSYYDYIGYLVALTSDGVLKWETHLTSDIQPYEHCLIYSEPCISSDGTVYINTCFPGGGSYGGGYLFAIGMQNPIDAPDAPIVTGETKVRPGRIYKYTLQATSSTGDDVYYFVDWGDYFFKEWFGPYPSGSQVNVFHLWLERGTFNIRVRAKTADGLCGPWNELQVTMPRDKATSNVLFWRLIEQFPILQKLLLQFGIYNN